MAMLNNQMVSHLIQSKSSRIHLCFYPSMNLSESSIIWSSLIWSSLTSNHIYPILSHPILSCPIHSYPMFSHPILSYIYYYGYFFPRYGFLQGFLQGWTWRFDTASQIPKKFSHGIPMILLLIGKGIAVSLQGSLAGTLENLLKKNRLLNLQQLSGSARVYFRRFSPSPWMPSDSSLMFNGSVWICQSLISSSPVHSRTARRARRASYSIRRTFFMSWRLNCPREESFSILVFVHYKSRKNNILDFAGYETYRDALFTELSELMSSSKGPSQIEHKPKRSGPCRSCPHPLLLHTSLLPAAPHQSAVHQLLINFSRNFCNMFVCLLSFHFEAKPIENLGPNTPASSLQVWNWIKSSDKMRQDICTALFNWESSFICITPSDRMAIFVFISPPSDQNQQRLSHDQLPRSSKICQDLPT